MVFEFSGGGNMMKLSHSSFTLFIFASIFFIHHSIYAIQENLAIVLDPKPRGVAIDPISNISVVAGEKTDSVSVVDLESQTTAFNILVGRMPRGVAIEKDSNVVLVGNSQDGTVSVIDMASFSVIKTIPVGQGPEGISINPLTSTALVANNKDNTVSVINLTTLTVVHVMNTGQGPIAVAVDPELNLALVANQTDRDLSVVDLTTYRVTRTIPAGKKPIAIDVNPETHLAVIATEKENAVTVLDLLTWQTKTIAIGKHPVDIAINVLDNRALIVCDEDRRLVVVDLNTSSVVQEYATSKLPKGVAVNNFTNIAGIADDYTDSLTLIQLPNPIPEVISLSNLSVLRGSGGETIMLTGSKLIKTSTAHLGTAPLETTFIDNHNLEIRIPEELLAKAGIYQISITNPAPSGGISNSLEFHVDNPVPRISAIGPMEVMAGTNSLTLNVYGTGFFDDTVMYVNETLRQPMFVSRTKLEVLLTSEDLKKSGIINITASNSAPGGGLSNKAVITIKPALEVSITSPSEGETINKARTIVKGYFKSETRDIGITVNGVIAEIVGSDWIASGVPLALGTNMITATIKDSVGNTGSKAVLITTEAVSEPVRLTANVTSGVAPLTVYFSISTSFVPVSYQLDFEGDGVIDYTGTTFENISHIYEQEGTFFSTVTGRDDQGNIYSDTTAIAVLNKTELDTLLKGKWEGMKGELVNRNIEGGLMYFYDGSKKSYRQVFNMILNDLPKIVSDMLGIEMIYVKDDLAKYRIRRDQNIDGTLQTLTYYIYFLRDRNGVWKINRF